MPRPSQVSPTTFMPRIRTQRGWQMQRSQSVPGGYVAGTEGGQGWVAGNGGEGGREGLGHKVRASPTWRNVGFILDLETTGESVWGSCDTNPLCSLGLGLEEALWAGQGWVRTSLLGPQLPGPRAGRVMPSLGNLELGLGVPGGCQATHSSPECVSLQTWGVPGSPGRGGGSQEAFERP